MTRQMPAQKPGKSKQDYATPWEFIRACKKKFGPLVVDLAATLKNTRCKPFILPEEDSFQVEWAKNFQGNMWLNPPFGDIASWAKKCAHEASSSVWKPGVQRILFLTPASVGANWYSDYIHRKHQVLALQPRLSFDGKFPYPKDCMLTVFGEPWEFDVWRWDA